MKPITLLSVVLLVAAQSANAQFLNKLKQKAQSAVVNAVAGKPADNTASDNGSPSQTSSPFPGDVKNNYKASQYGRAIIELQNGEHVVYGEHTLSIVSNQTLTKVITQIGRQYFLYENDKRTGPFNTPPVDKLDNWRQNLGDYSYDGNEKRTDWQSYVSKGILLVDGKAYGEVTSLGSFYHNKAKKKFYATTVKMGTNGLSYYLVSENGIRQLPFIASELLISENDEFGGIIVTATQYNAKTDEERMKFLLNDDIYVLLSNGKTIGPLAAVQADQNYLDNNGNFIQVAKSRKAIFMNGKQVATLPADLNGEGRFYANTSGQSGAWFERGSLYFSDGTQIINYAIQPAVSVDNSKQVLNWLSIQDHKVYVCKKEL